MNITATAYREGPSPYWTVHVVGDGIDQMTQARHLDEVQDMAADAAAIMTDREAKDFQVEVAVRGADDVTAEWAAARAEADTARAAADEAARRAREAARIARDRYKTRDAAFLLGVNQQRISQLTARKSA